MVLEQCLVQLQSAVARLDLDDIETAFCDLQDYNCEECLAPIEFDLIAAWIRKNVSFRPRLLTTYFGEGLALFSAWTGNERLATAIQKHSFTKEESERAIMQYLAEVADRNESKSAALSVEYQQRPLVVEVTLDDRELYDSYRHDDESEESES